MHPRLVERSQMLRHADMDGFTITELIVGMLLLTVFAVAGSKALVDMFASSNRSASARDAQSAAAHVFERFGQDLAAAEAPARTEVKKDKLRRHLLYGDPTTPPNAYQDIVAATDSSIWFRANVASEAAGQLPTAECVGYFLNGSRELVRQVRDSAANCPGGGAVLSNDVLLPRPPRGQAAEHVFRYTLTFNPNNGIPTLNPNDCATYANRTSVTALERNYIAAVALDLRSFAGSGSTTGEARFLSSFGVELRSNSDYRYAMGCAF